MEGKWGVRVNLVWRPLNHVRWTDEEKYVSDKLAHFFSDQLEEQKQCFRAQRTRQQTWKPARSQPVFCCWGHKLNEVWDSLITHTVTWWRVIYLYQQHLRTKIILLCVFGTGIDRYIVFRADTDYYSSKRPIFGTDMFCMSLLVFGAMLLFL